MSALANPFLLTLALVGVAIIVAALLSGVIERSDLPQVGVFLALGAVLGPAGLGLLEITLDSPILRVVATVSLVLVLFTDAVGLTADEVSRHRALAFRVLGPGTLLSAVLIALAAYLLLGVPFGAAAIIGAALASTDPIMLRGLLRRPELPEPVRLGLRLESGLNDAVLLPVILLAMASLQEDLTGNRSAQLGLELFVLGPGAGVAVGLLAVGALELVRRKTGVRRDYESLYSLGIAFAAYAAAEAVHGSGFLAAFCAGLTIAVLDVELCDCFHEYGRTTAEMTLLFTFILFGSAPIWSGLTIVSAKTLLFAAAVLLARPVAFSVSLARTSLDRRSRLLIGWFGPRGLSSLLLILVPAFAGLADSERWFVVCSLIVLISIVLHGGSLILLRGKIPLLAAAAPASENASAAAATGAPAAPREFITADQITRLKKSAAALVVLDVRRELAGEHPQGAVRVLPEEAEKRLTELGVSKESWVVALCA